MGKAWVPWGAVIQGIPVGNDWIRVGEYYLPVRLNGVLVLKREASSLAGTARSHCCKTPIQASNRKDGASALVMRPRVQSPSGSPAVMRVAPHLPAHHCLRPTILQYPSLVPAPSRALACCAWDAWEGLQIADVPALSPYKEVIHNMLANKAVVAVHHILPNTTVALGKLYNVHVHPEHIDS